MKKLEQIYNLATMTKTNMAISSGVLFAIGYVIGVLLIKISY